MAKHGISDAIGHEALVASHRIAGKIDDPFDFMLCVLAASKAAWSMRKQSEEYVRNVSRIAVSVLDGEAGTS